MQSNTLFHPTGLPVVPLARQMPAWVPAGALIDYLTGTLPLIAAGSILLNRNARTLVSFLGAWILALVVFIYTPVLFSGLAASNVGGQIEGVNYFADTLLFAGTVLRRREGDASTRRRRLVERDQRT